MKDIVSLSFFIASRILLHLFYGAILYASILNYTNIPKLVIFFIIFLFATLLEYFQHKVKITDSLSRFVLIRELSIITSLIIIFSILFLFNQYLTTHHTLSILLTFLVLSSLLMTYLETISPEGEHWEWKHYLDILSWTLSPIIMYPLIKYFLL